MARTHPPASSPIDDAGWAVGDAKNRFSELLSRAEQEGPQSIVRRGKRFILSAAESEPAPRGREGASAGRRVLLIIGGGVAGYKCLELIRLFARAGIGVETILTAAGKQFVTPLSVAALSGAAPYEDLFSLTNEAEMGHIQLSRAADLVLVAPATADLMAKMAHGLANDLASTALLATDKPVMIAPAMNVRMWEHKATQRNVAQLIADGVRLIGPDSGPMACGEFGPGRMAEPTAILDAVLDYFAEREAARPLAGRRVIVTAGPTLEAIDPVRFISNRSSGKQGYALAEALAALGADVRLISGPVALAAPRGVQLERVESAREMLAACEAALPADAAVCVAAVADWRPARNASIKIKKEGKAAEPIDLIENPDILARLSRGPQRPQLVIGFAAETHDVENFARAKLTKKGCDWIVANDVSGDVMGGEENEVLLFRPDGVERWPRMAKELVARRLAEAIAAELLQPERVLEPA